MRSFVALPLPDDLAADLARFAQRLKLTRPQPEDNMHITLAFLDDQPDAALEALHEELSATRFAPVTAGFSGLMTLGGKIPSVLALGVTGVDGLHKQVTGAARRAGMTLPHRRFRAHVTLARLPRRPSHDDQVALGHVLERHGATGFAPRGLTTLSLYRSDLHPDGARYQRLADYPLAV